MDLRTSAITRLCLAAPLAAPSAAGADPPPYGPGAPAWADAPDWTAQLPADGGRVRRPRGLTELDAWLLNAEYRVYGWAQ